MATYLRLFPATTQFELTNGQLNVAGRLYVYFEGTDDLADVYDEDGTQLTNPVILDNDGRAAGLFVDASKVYWLKVCNQFDAQQFTVRKMVPSGGGAGSALGKTYEVVSSDGTVEVQTYSDAGVITFDLSTSIEQQASPYGGFIAMASSVAGDEEWHEVPVVSSQGDITYMGGWNVMKDCVGDIAASLEMTSGDPAALHTIDVMCMFMVDGTAVTTEYGMLDPTEPSGRVTFEWKGSLVDENRVDVKFYVRSSGAATVGLIGRALYNEEVEGIIGNGGGGGAGEYYGGDYIEISGQVINATGLQPVADMTAYQTTAGMSAYQASGHYQTAGNYASSTDLLDYQPTSSMGDYQLTADMTAYMPISATAGLFTGVETDSSITGNGLSGSALGVNTAVLEPYQKSADMSAYQPSGDYVSSSELANYQTTAGMSSYLETSSFTGYTATALTAIENNITSIQNDITGIEQDISSIESAISGLTGTYVEQSAFTGYTASADSSFVHTGDMTAYQPSGDYVSSSELENYQTTAGMSAYATTAELAQKLDASASSSFQPSGDYVSSSELFDYQTTAGMSAYATTGDLAQKLDSSASSSFQPAGDYASSSDLTAYQTTAGMSSYVDYSSIGVDSASEITGINGSAIAVPAPVSLSSTAGTIHIIDNDLEGTDTAYFYETSEVTSIFTESSIASATSYGTSVVLSYIPSGDWTVTATRNNGYGPFTATLSAGDWSSEQQLAWGSTGGEFVFHIPTDLTGAQLTVMPYGMQSTASWVQYEVTGSATSIVTSTSTAKLAHESDLTAYQTTSGMSAYQQTSSMSAYQTTAGMSAYQKTSGMSAYQKTAEMTAYMPITAATGFVEKSATLVTIGSSNIGFITSMAQGVDNWVSGTSFVQGVDNWATTCSMAQGLSSTAQNYSMVQGVENTAKSASVAHGSANSADVRSIAAGGHNTAYADSLAVGAGNSASNGGLAIGDRNTAADGVAVGTELSAIHNVAAFGQLNLRGDGHDTGDNIAFVIGDGYSTRHDLMAVTKDGEITMFSSTSDNVGIGIISSLRALSGSASGYATTGDLANYQPTSSMSAFQETSGMSAYQTTAGMSAYQTTAGMTGYLPESASSEFMPATANPFTGVETDSTLTGNGLSGNELGVNGMELDFDTSMSTSVSGNTATIGVNTGILSGYQTTAGMSAYQTVDGMTAYQPSGAYQTAGDYVSSSELADYQTTAGMSAYQPSGAYQTAGDYVSSSELADYQTTAGMSAYQTVADMTAYQETSGMTAYQTVEGMSAYQPSGSYQTAGDYVSSSELADYQTTAGMSAYQASGNYVSSSDMSAYQETSGMSAYIPLSALGLVEI